MGKIIEYRVTNLELFRDHPAQSLNYSHKGRITTPNLQLVAEPGKRP